MRKIMGLFLLGPAFLALAWILPGQASDPPREDKPAPIRLRRPVALTLADGAADVVNLKISKLGGLTRTVQARDLCVSVGIAMTLEDSWGGDITTAAIAHLAHSTPPEFLFTATDFNSYVTVSTADGAPRRANGHMAAGTAPGLGVAPKPDVLGRRVVEVS